MLNFFKHTVFLQNKLEFWDLIIFETLKALSIRNLKQLAVNSDNVVQFQLKIKSEQSPFSANHNITIYKL